MRREAITLLAHGLVQPGTGKNVGQVPFRHSALRLIIMAQRQWRGCWKQTSTSLSLEPIPIYSDCYHWGIFLHNLTSRSLYLFLVVNLLFQVFHFVLCLGFLWASKGYLVSLINTNRTIGVKISGLFSRTGLVCHRDLQSPTWKVRT